MEVKPIQLREIPPEIVSGGKRAGLIFRDKENALYFGGFVDGKLVSLICLVVHRKTATIKTNFTVEEHRGKGYFTELNRYVLKYARDHGIRSITLNCLKGSVGIHTKAGARLWKTTKNIHWMVYDEGF